MSRSLTVGELIELLEDHDPDAVVMLAHQPAWPLAEVLAGVVHSADMNDDLDADRDPDEDLPKGDGCLWLVAGGHAWDRSPYAPRSVFDVAGVSAW